MTPDERPFVALRGEMPKWLPARQRAAAADRRRRVHGHAVAGRRARGRCTTRSSSTSRPPAPSAERRIRLFRLAWDFLGSELGGRGELYERFYLSDSWRMTALAYNIADKSFPESLVEQFLRD